MAKSVRVLLVATVAAAALTVGAGPVLACQPDRPCPPCSYDETWNTLMRKLGHPC